MTQGNSIADALHTTFGVPTGITGIVITVVSLLIIVAMLAIWRVPLTLNILYVIPILITLVTVVFGISCFLLHYGVFVEDLSNVLNIALRFLFYLTGIFWNIMDRLPAPYNSYIGRCNQIAFLLTSARDCVIYGSPPPR